MPLPPKWADESVARPSAGSAEEQEVARLAAERCPENDWRRYANAPLLAPGPIGARGLPTPLRGFWFLPSAEHWASGGRWIRCDVGTDWSDGTPPELGWRGSIVELRDPRDRLLLSADCRLTDGEAARAVPCHQPHDVEVASVYRVTGPRPQAPSGTSRWEDACRDDVASYLGVRTGSDGTPGYRYDVSARPAAEREWDAGDRTIACWLSYRRRSDGVRIRTGEPAVGLGGAEPRPVGDV